MGQASVFVVDISPCPVMSAIVSRLFPPCNRLESVAAKILLQPDSRL
jgi:hypothetical protein